MRNRFYAVQVGDDYSQDYGSTRKRNAIVMAHAEMRSPRNNGKEVRIAVCDYVCQDSLNPESKDWEVTSTIVLREGKNGYLEYAGE